MAEFTQTQLLDLLRPDEDRLKAEVVNRQEFEVAFQKAWDAAERLEGNDRAQAMAFSRLAQLRISRDKQTQAILDLEKTAPPRDLTALNLTELQVLGYYTAVAAGEEYPLDGCTWQARAIIDTLRRVRP